MQQQYSGVLLAGAKYILDKVKSDDVTKIKGTSIVYSYSGDTSTVELDENGNILSTRVVIGLNDAKNGYEVKYYDDAQYRKSVKERFEKQTSISPSRFSNYELAVFGSLMDNGLGNDVSLEYFTEEELHCLPTFIKAEAATQNLDLRSNSQKIKGNEYIPEGINTKDNKIPGTVLVQRTTVYEDGTTSQEILEYAEKDDFENNQSNRENYFTIDEKGNLIIAKWTSTDGAVTYTTETIAYNNYVKKYTMPFEFLVQLLIVSDSPDFCNELVEEYILNSKIIINIKEVETTRIEEIEVEVEDDSEAAGEAGEAAGEAVGEDEEQNTETIEIEIIEHTYTFGISEVDNWLMHYTESQDEEETVETSANPMNIHIYATKSGEPGRGHGKTEPDEYEKFLKLYDEYGDVRNNLESIDIWLYEMMEQNENTVVLIDYVKYLLYMYDGVDRGVTEIDTSIFRPDEFVKASGGGSVIWKNDITKDDFVNLIKSYNVPSGNGNYGSTKWGYEKYFIPNAENFYEIATKYGLDPRFIFCIGVHESYFGTSNIANEKGNFFGWGAYDSSPYASAKSFYDMSNGIETVCSGLAKNYVSEDGMWYQWILEKGHRPESIDGIGSRYASDTNWANAIKKHMLNIFNYAPTSDNAFANEDFLVVAEKCHNYVADNKFFYSSDKNKKAGEYVGDGISTGNGRIPYPNGTQYIDCSAYVTWVLYEYGYTELTSQRSSHWFADKKTMESMGWTVLDATEAQAGDIVARNGHVEIYAGDGKFYNAGATSAIRKKISNSGVGHLKDFTYAIRVTPAN